MYERVLHSWTLSNGFESERWPSFPDWHGLKAAVCLTPGN